MNNAHMARQPHVYGWDEEPADERPSEFAPSTGYSLLSGYHDDALSPEERARVRAHLAMCAACSAVLTAYETMYATLQRVVAPVISQTI